MDVYTVCPVSNEQQPQGLQIVVPPDIGNGVYANAASVWHTPFEFTLDFLCLGMPDESSDRARAEVVARVKIPTNVIFQVATAIAEHVDTYEKRFGPITPVPPAGPVDPRDEETVE